jgi:uncharacterized membrane protein YoaK (UPF0700 family)
MAGYVDALGFLKLGGFFVSFMSGNTTRLGVGLAGMSWHAALAGTLIAIFVVGVVVGSLVGHVAGSQRPAAVLALVAVLLGVAAGFSMLGVTGGAIAAMALAMGAENAVFERGGEVSIGLTYMTGTLVRFGQRLTGALLGGKAFGWVSYLFLWTGLAGGAVAGAAAYPHWGLNGLWIAAAAAAIFAAIAAVAGLGPADVPPRK